MVGRGVKIVGSSTGTGVVVTGAWTGAGLENKTKRSQTTNNNKINKIRRAMIKRFLRVIIEKVNRVFFQPPIFLPPLEPTQQRLRLALLVPLVLGLQLHEHLLLYQTVLTLVFEQVFLQQKILVLVFVFRQTLFSLLPSPTAVEGWWLRSDLLCKRRQF